MKPKKETLEMRILNQHCTIAFPCRTTREQASGALKLVVVGHTIITASLASPPTIIPLDAEAEQPLQFGQVTEITPREIRGVGVADYLGKGICVPIATLIADLTTTAIDSDEEARTALSTLEATPSEDMEGAVANMAGLLTEGGQMAVEEIAGNDQDPLSEMAKIVTEALAAP